MFWVNDPSTVSPITADNLSRLEKYTLATAGSNGDFYVNFPNGGSIATNDIVYILFPAATNGASNARLSVNNGTTYKNIVLSTTRIASEVASRKLSFVYDGTNFVPIETEFFPIAFTPVLTAGTGTLGSYSVTSCSYIKVGRKVTMWFDVTVVTVGTGSGALNISLPLISRAYSSIFTADGSGSVRLGQGYTALNGSTFSLLQLNNTTLIIAGTRPIGVVTYLTD